MTLMKIASCLSWIAVAFLASCSSSPWKRPAPPLYQVPGLVLYREHEERDGQQVPLGYKHPIGVTPEKVALLLSQLVFRDDFLLTSKETYVLTKEEIGKIAEPLSEALKVVTPDERLRFLVLHDMWQEVILGNYGTTGVIFSTQDGVVNIAFDAIRQRVSVPDGGEPMKVTFSGEPTEITGKSPILPAAGMKIHMGPDGTQYTRWIEVTLADVKPLPPPALAEKTSPPAPPVTVVVPDRPPLPGSPEPAPATAAPPAASTAPKSSPEEDRYQRARKKLESLNRLRKDGAITEEQFQSEYAKAMAELQ
jgi:hypothetical protein